MFLIRLLVCIGFIKQFIVPESFSEGSSLLVVPAAEVPAGPSGRGRGADYFYAQER